MRAMWKEGAKAPVSRPNRCRSTVSLPRSHVSPTLLEHTFCISALAFRSNFAPPQLEISNTVKCSGGRRAKASGQMEQSAYAWCKDMASCVAKRPKLLRRTPTLAPLPPWHSGTPALRHAQTLPRRPKLGWRCWSFFSNLGFEPHFGSACRRRKSASPLNCSLYCALPAALSVLEFSLRPP